MPPACRWKRLYKSVCRLCGHTLVPMILTCDGLSAAYMPLFTTSFSAVLALFHNILISQPSVFNIVAICHPLILISLRSPFPSLSLHRQVHCNLISISSLYTCSITRIRSKCRQAALAVACSPSGVVTSVWPQLNPPWCLGKKEQCLNSLTYLSFRLKCDIFNHTGPEGLTNHCNTGVAYGTQWNFDEAMSQQSTLIKHFTPLSIQNRNATIRWQTVIMIGTSTDLPPKKLFD